MKTKKEIIIICSIISISIIFVLLFQFKVFSSADFSDVSTNSQNFVSIQMKGEVLVERSFEVPKGVTYAYVLKKNSLYLNEYSFITENLYSQILEDTVIEVKTYDTGAYESTIIDDKINLYTASFEELITVYGIGEKRANQIIEYRKNNKFQNFEEVKKILGVSNEVMARIKEQATL